MRRGQGFAVSPLSRAEIRERADQVRASLGITTPAFPVLDVIELDLPKLNPDFAFEVVDPAEMNQRYGPGVHGMTFPDELHMVVRQDVYMSAYHGSRLHRFTLAHELGHLLMHARVGMAKRVTMTTPIYSNSEWQADAFAGEVLVSWRHVVWNDTPATIARKFNVSYGAARTMCLVFKEDGML